MSSRKISVNRMVKRIRTIQPQSARELRAVGIELRLLGKGLFRSGYKIRNCDLVIKFPVGNEGRLHTRDEVRKLKRLKKDVTLARFLPKVFYHDPKSGVILMQFYPQFRDFEALADSMGRMLGELVYRATRIRCSDVHTENVRRGKFDRVILIDLGY